MTDTNDEDRRPGRGGRRAPQTNGGRSFLTRRPKDDGERPRAAPRRLPGEAPQVEKAAEPASAEERIAKVIARAGLASRREAEAMIEAGRVALNGEIVTSPALNVGPDDRIVVDGEPLPSRERTRLWLFHKPRGLVTTFRDPEGRPTVFESLPEDMPRVVAIGRLDINTEGLLLLTNDGGLAKVIAQPATGWTRRYRARAHGGEVTQADLDKLRRGITIDGMEYGPVDATLDRVQGDNSWISLALREGKNREVKRILEHLGLQVNRLIRLSFGPFQLGEIEPGLVEEVRTKVLKEQLGSALAAEAGADFESPVRTPIAPFGREPAAPSRPPRPRRAGEDERRPRGPGRGFHARGEEDPRRARSMGGERGKGREERADDRRKTREERPLVWRADEEARLPRPPRRERRVDPKAERAASAERPRSRGKPIDAEGRRILVERIATPAADERPARHRRDRGGEGAPGRAPRGTSFGKPERRGPGGAERGAAGRGGAPSRHKPGRSGGAPGGRPHRGGGRPKGRGA